MTVSRFEGMASSKKLYRTLESAPDPHRRAQAIYSELIRAEGWARKDEEKILAFGAWLGTRPPPSALKDRCRQLFAALG